MTGKKRGVLAYRAAKALWELTKTMDASLKAQTKEALRNGAAEIDRLPQENAMLALKAQAFDTISGLIRLLAPRPNQGYAPDAAWIMRTLLADIEKPAAKKPSEQ